MTLIFAGRTGHFVGFVVLWLNVLCNDLKFSDRYAWANSADPEEQSDQGLHCLPFCLHRLDSLHNSRAT